VRQSLQAGHEGEPDRLACLVAGTWLVRLIGDVLEQRVGVGLEPDRLAQPAGLWRLWRLGRRLGQRREPPAAVAKRVQGAVRGDPVEPGAQRGATLEPSNAAPRCQQSLLDEIFGVLDRADDPVAVDLELATVRIDELSEGSLVPGARSLEQVRGCVSIRRLHSLGASEFAAAIARRSPSAS